MTKKNDASTHIYADVLDQIRGIFSALDQNVYEYPSRGACNTAKGILRDVEQVLRQRVDDLQRQSEWDTFTIAFYGEANAGKSTLVECLRILLKEHGKIAQRQRFRALQKQFGLYEHDLNLLEQQASKFEHRQIEAQQKMAEADRQYGQQETALTHKANELLRSISEQKHSAGFFSRLRSLVHKLPEELTLQRMQRQLTQLSSQHTVALERLKRQQSEAQIKHKRIMHQQQTALDNRHQLEVYEDGLTLRDDPNSDAAHEMHSYTFELKGRTFRIVDMPSLENSAPAPHAITYAHAVFYVTHSVPSAENDAEDAYYFAPIQAHLGAQTEIWTVFNKPVSNPMVLRKASLISKEEHTGLAQMDRQMRALFGRHYRRCVTLSALPGLLALADCLIPLSKKSLDRKVFVDALTTENLLRVSGVDNFVQLLVQMLSNDCDAKMRQANLYKLSVAINSVCRIVEQLGDEQFLPLQEDLHKEAKVACGQLDNALHTLDHAVTDLGRQAIMLFGGRVRQQMAAKIEKGISNDDFEIALQAIMGAEQEAIQDNVPERFDHRISQFHQQVAEILARFETHVQDILSNYEHAYQLMLSNALGLNIEAASSTRFNDLMAAVEGRAQRCWRPVHWVTMTLRDVMLLSGLFKSIWGYFSEDCQQTQQYRAVEKNIRKAYRELSYSFHQSQREDLQPLKQEVEEVKALLWWPEQETKRLCALIRNAERQLVQMTSTLVTSEGKA